MFWDSLECQVFGAEFVFFEVREEKHVLNRNSSSSDKSELEGPYS